MTKAQTETCEPAGPKARKLAHEFAEASELQFVVDDVARTIENDPSLEAALRASVESHALRKKASEHAERLADSRGAFEEAQALSRRRMLA
jgi:hypothetical protein